MENLKKIIELAKSDDNKNKIIVGALLSGQSFDFFCIFIEYFAIRAKAIIKKESLGLSFTHIIELSNCDLTIQTVFEQDEQKFFTYVYTNDVWAARLMEKGERFILQSNRPTKEEILKALQ